MINDLSEVYSRASLVAYAKEKRGTRSFFSPGNMRGTNCRILRGLTHASYENKTVLVFITSERESMRTPRLYTIRTMTESADVSRLRLFKPFKTAKAARKALAQYLKDNGGIIPSATRESLLNSDFPSTQIESVLFGNQPNVLEY